MGLSLELTLTQLTVEVEGQVGNKFDCRKFVSVDAWNLKADRWFLDTTNQIANESLNPGPFKPGTSEPRFISGVKHFHELGTRSALASKEGLQAAAVG
jgi:hypothetical protein